MTQSPNRPVLGIISCNREVSDQPAQAVMTRYISSSLVYADAAGLLIPAMPELMRAREVAPRLDGLLLTGSPSNLDPKRYGQLVDDAPGPFDPERDEMTARMVEAMLELGKPVFGICRGLQLINVAFGGTLYQDIGTQQPQALLHRDAQAYDLNFHQVELVPDSRLAQLLPGENRHTINSVHHQGVKQLAEGFVIEARCPDDGIIEAIRHAAGAWVAAVQWHPEFHKEEHGTLNDAPILRDFLAAARATRTD